MRYPVSRVVDLLDPALNDISNMDVDEARRRVLRGDAADVRAIDGSFALVASEGTVVRMARSLDRPMRYFLAKRAEGPALFVADRIDAMQRRSTPKASRASSIRATRAWCRRTTSSRCSSSAAPIPTRPTRASSRRRATACRPTSTRSAAATSAPLADEIVKWLRGSSARHRRRAVRRRVLRRHRQRRGLSRDLSRHACSSACPRRGSRRSRSTSATARTCSRPPVSRPARAVDCSSKRSRPRRRPRRRTRRSACSRTTSRSTSSARRWACALPRHPRALPGVAVPGRRRRRRREPQGLPDRGEPGADDPQRDRQPDALPGRLGRRPDQALAHLQRRAEPQLRPHLCAGPPLRLPGFSPYTRPNVIEVAEGIPFVALTNYDVPTLYALKGEIVRPRREGR